MAVISPFGLGSDVFTAGIREGRRGLTPVPADLDVPYAEQGVVPGFDIGDILGETRNLRVLGRAASLAVGTVALLTREHDLTDYPSTDRALVLGGDLIGTDRAMELTRESMTNPVPFQVDTKQFPSSVMNNSAAQCAIRFGLQGPNTTVTTGRMSGLSALGYTRRLHAAGRAPMVVATAVEDLNPRRSWLTWHGHGAQSTDPLGEGCCAFLVESRDGAAARGRSPIAELVALEFGLAPNPDLLAETMTTVLSRVLRKASVDPADRPTVVVSGPWAGAELAAVAAVLGTRTRVLEPASRIGDTDGASAAFQLATAIAQVPHQGDLAVITSSDPDGQVGCAVFRIPTTQEQR
ncbi:beta-ketoacyl synthase N-terminal-like domain-containing protein [Actinosynnema sp. NPDC020468]|uniref:beta-ketoacyl synthase N-terminal-like domain-containing protein n=1 Tax=Actinosynnema sp. NPDC020468 TaxID=3154488 RepID=UPI0034002589